MVKTLILPIQPDIQKNNHFYMQPLNNPGSEESSRIVMYVH